MYIFIYIYVYTYIYINIYVYIYNALTDLNPAKKGKYKSKGMEEGLGIGGGCAGKGCVKSANLNGCVGLIVSRTLTTQRNRIMAHT